ncbi:MAG: periplasmic heavy metal sensor [Alphaproteobacteria bacterium]|nr:periplasmic heavy metal sensor [Alphaproteobacteria bacterium]
MVTPAPETPASAAPATGWQRWRGPLLFASVCINLFLVGVMIGGAVPPRHRPHWFDRWHAAGEPGPGPRAGAPGMQAMPGGAGPALAFRQAVQSLPASDRRAFEESMEGVRPDLQRSQRELRQARQRVHDIVRADQFDKQAMLAALSDVRQRQEAIQQRIHAAATEALAKLSPESRRQFADTMIARLRP